MKQLVFAGLGVELVSLILASVWLGPKLDDYFETKGVFLVIMLIMVLVGWFVRLFFLLKKLNASEDSN
jgi:F0F1-type ATP synthase assembly protein I